MMKQFFLLVFILTAYISSAQTKVLITFTDKDGVTMDPYSYFDQKAIDRRIKHHIPLVTFSDLPVRQDYVDGVAALVDSTKLTSRWLNGVVAYTNDSGIEQLRKSNYVRSVEVLRPVELVVAEIKADTIPEDVEKLMNAQIDRMGRKTFKEKGINGSGVRIAIFDVGFKYVQENKSFEHIRANDRILATKNFVNKKSVYHKGTHGTNVLSCIAGKYGDTEMGLATEAEFLLAKTERIVWEPLSEEENWVAAAEWADKNGADIISSSLGYGYHRYFQENMDGHTSLVSMGARMASRKGILVVNSAGNEGAGKWTRIITPADVDSVMCVGGIDPQTGLGIEFTSFGPTADYIPKPNVVSFGSVIASGKSGLHRTQGTSFSCPLISGYAACILQSNPELTNMQLFKTIEESADLYPYFDYRHGYGVPSADLYYAREDVEPTFKIEKLSTSHYELYVTDEAFDIVEKRRNDMLRKIPGGYAMNRMHAYSFIQNRFALDKKREVLYYKIVDEEGRIVRFEVIDVFEKLVLVIKKHELPENGKVVIHFLGYTEEFKL